MQFRVVPSHFLRPELLCCAHVTGADRFVWRSRIHWDGAVLHVERSPAESGFFHLLADVPGWGRTLLSTAWLMPRPAPYHLQVELARGMFHQVRTQAQEWMALGLRPQPQVHARLHRGFVLLREAVLSPDPETAGQKALGSLVESLWAGQFLVRSYAQQGFAGRLLQADSPPPWLGIHLGETVPQGKFAQYLPEVFHMVQVALNWRQVQPDESPV